MRSARSFLVGPALLALGAAATGVAVAGPVEEIFERRIRPIAQSERASSCVDCHFSGVDLKQYVLADAVQTFAALREAGLIDVEHPENSRLLQFIDRKPSTEHPLSAQVRAAESAAFREWIVAAAADPAIRRAPKLAATVGPAVAAEVVRFARYDQVLQAFVEDVWIERERCVNCHSPDRNQRLVAKQGEHLSWIIPDDPAGTPARCLEHGLIDLRTPSASLLLRKPLAEVEHGGHQKFTIGSRTDRRFRRFLEHYAAAANGKYRRAAQLPASDPDWHLATGRQLKITDLPAEYGGKLLRADLHRATPTGWTERPVATAESTVNGEKRVRQNLVFALIPRDTEPADVLLKARMLPAARYQVRVYVDRENRAGRDRDSVLTDEDLAATLEFDGAWPPGYQPPKTVLFSAP